MKSAKPVGTPLAGHFKLSSTQSLSSEREKKEMVKTPCALAVGSMVYVMICMRPNIAYTAGVVSRFIVNHGKEHWAALKWILRYLRNTSNICISFENDKPKIKGFKDADLGGDMDSRKSTLDSMFKFIGRAVS